MTELNGSSQSTPLEVIACVSRVITKTVDRITGDRVDYPLMVSGACVEALKLFGIESRIMFGPAAWIELLEDHSLIWAGCWGEFFSFWVATQYGEVVDLNTSVAFKKKGHTGPNRKAVLSAPMLWSKEVPAFYRYQPEGIAEIELTEERDRRWYELVVKEVREKCTPEKIKGLEPEFPNEAILCPGKKILDDSLQSFKQLDRALLVRGIPAAPF
jgi:hypothetical protein